MRDTPSKFIEILDPKDSSLRMSDSDELDIPNTTVETPEQYSRATPPELLTYYTPTLQ
ncbi:hypothetical protein PENPOL_c001G03125 [Penicillium polonicum]|uniref:Uncharacterized protein n=1 Tax=Penicillium polonicum TaxID=60169 RepID=A0A1V6P4Z7_PENPO|nr:hypothetical protein PENPOL_c001G03125 [Penicillium polonicum]